MDYSVCEANYAKRLKTADADKQRQPEVSWMDKALSVHTAVKNNIKDGAAPLWLRSVDFVQVHFNNTTGPLFRRKVNVFSECAALNE